MCSRRRLFVDLPESLLGDIRTIASGVVRDLDSWRTVSEVRGPQICDKLDVHGADICLHRQNQYPKQRAKFDHPSLLSAVRRNKETLCPVGTVPSTARVISIRLY